MIKSSISQLVNRLHFSPTKGKGRIQRPQITLLLTVFVLHSSALTAPDVRVCGSQGLNYRPRGQSSPCAVLGSPRPSWAWSPPRACCWGPASTVVRTGRDTGAAATTPGVLEASFIKGLIEVTFLQAQEDPSLSVNV